MSFLQRVIYNAEQYILHSSGVTMCIPISIIIRLVAIINRAQADFDTGFVAWTICRSVGQYVCVCLSGALHTFRLVRGRI